MVAAGGIGNLVDRTQLGYVRDFFEFTFMDFAIFNIADAFVTVGAIVLIVALILMLVFPSKDKRIPQDDEKEGEKAAFTVESADEASGARRTVTKRLLRQRVRRAPKTRETRLNAQITQPKVPIRRKMPMRRKARAPRKERRSP